MATAIRNERRVIDQAIIEALAAEVVLEANPEIEDQPVIFDALTRASAVTIQPALESLVQAYLNACTTTRGRIAARLFMQNLIDAEA